MRRVCGPRCIRDDELWKVLKGVKEWARGNSLRRDDEGKEEGVYNA